MHYDKNLIYIVLGLTVIFIFTFKPELLIGERTFKIVAVVCAAEFLAGVVLHFTAEAHSASGGLLAPLPTLGYFRVCLMWFRKLVHREPVDVAYNWSSGLFLDRVFAFVFLGGAFPIVFAAIFGVEKLANAGW